MAISLKVDSNGVPYIGNADNNNFLTVPTEQYVKVNGVYIPVSSAQPLPTQPGDGTNQQKFNADGSINAILSGSNVTQNFQLYTLNIAAGAQAQYQFPASTGKIARVNYLGVYVPGIATATTGNQQIYVTLGTATGYSDQRILSVTGASASSGVDVNASNNVAPLTELRFSDIIPLVVTIFNSTDVAQTGTAMIQVNYTEATIP